MKVVMKNLAILVILIFLHYDTTHGLPVDAVRDSQLLPVDYLQPGEAIDNDKPGLHIFCHNARPKSLVHTWKTLIMNLHTNIDTYELYDGRSPYEVVEKHEDNQRSWKFNVFDTRKSKQLKISPFEDTCIGVYTRSNQHKYTMSMRQLHVDVWKVMTMMIGCILFWYAERLSKNVVFYYLSGITLGVTTSVIILIYFLGKLFPRGKFMYMMVAAGWTMSFYLAQTLLDNAQLIMMQYREWVMWYILITSFISFIICYRFGPVTNVRTKKILQWFLQIFGLVMVYYSSYFREATIACSILLLLLYNFPTVIIHKGRKYWRTLFPQPRKLLTDEEFREEGVRETKKALTDLKGYCSSPECNPWRTVLKLKDPKRFAKFMEYNSHLLDDEVEDYDAEVSKLIEECEYTDDDDDDY